MKQKLLFLYHLTTIVCIDDNRKYLNALSLELNNVGLTCKTFDNPAKALDYFENSYNPATLAVHAAQQSDVTFAEKVSSSLNIAELHKEINNPYRFYQVSTIVIDYAMPGMNGLEFSEKLKAKHSNIMIILLTGEADEKLAVDGFNRGIIDKFIRKDDKDFMSSLQNSIQEMQVKYFQLSSNIIKSMLPINDDATIPFYDDPVYLEFFANLLTKENISEYCLLESSGSYLLIDNNGNNHHLIVKSETEMQSFYEIAENSDAPANIIKKLKNKEALPYFGSNGNFETPPAQWGKYLRPARVLIGKHNHYIAYF